MSPPGSGHGSEVTPDPPVPATVVLVDDRDDLRRLLGMLLDDEPDFLVVGEGSNGREAIELVQQHQPDLVILDNDMPVMTGMEALPHIVETSPTCVVLFSAEAETHRERALELGAAEAISKSTGVMSFVEQLRAVMATKGDCAEPAPPWKT